MLERSPINFNSTRTSDSGKTDNYTVGLTTNCYPECTTTHHFDIKTPKKSQTPLPVGRGTPLPTPHPLGASILSRPVPPQLKSWLRPCKDHRRQERNRENTRLHGNPQRDGSPARWVWHYLVALRRYSRSTREMGDILMFWASIFFAAGP